MTIESKLVPNRNCDECSVCCISVRIDEDTLKKTEDIPCPNLDQNQGCGIYENRPEVCKFWYCGWKIMANLSNSWRPDRIGILIRIDPEGKGLILQIIDNNPNILLDEEPANFIANSIKRGINISISVPTKPNYCNCITNLNEYLSLPLQFGNKTNFLEKLEEIIQFSDSFKTDKIMPLEK